MKTSLRYRCKHDRCNEWTFSEYDSRKEANDPSARSHRDNWKCARHFQPEGNLSTDNRTVTKRMTVMAKENGKYFDGIFGFVSGPGFRAWAEDFPEGAVLEVTASINL